MPAACFRPRCLGWLFFNTCNLNDRTWRECLMRDSFSRVAPADVQEPTRTAETRYSHIFDQASTQTENALAENIFHSMLTLERRRAERSRKPFVLMLLDANLENGSAAAILNESGGVIMGGKRGTELVG